MLRKTVLPEHVLQQDPLLTSASPNIALKALRCSQRGWASTSWPSWASDGVGRGEWALDPDGPNFLIGFYL